MTHVSFEEYEAAKAEIIGGVQYKENSTLEGTVIRKTYTTEENGTFYEVNDGGRVEFWSDKHPETRIYDENERAGLPENVGAVPGYGDLLAEKIKETADFANLKPFEKFVLDNGYLYDSSDALKAGYRIIRPDGLRQRRTGRSGRRVKYHGGGRKPHRREGRRENESV